MEEGFRLYRERLVSCCLDAGRVQPGVLARM
jgi:hypothetical protein